MRVLPAVHTFFRSRVPGENVWFYVSPNLRAPTPPGTLWVVKIHQTHRGISERSLRREREKNHSQFSLPIEMAHVPLRREFHALNRIPLGEYYYLSMLEDLVKKFFRPIGR